MQTITEIMVKDHTDLALLLNEFNEERTEEKLKNFRFALEKHLAVEEKAIFINLDFPEIKDDLVKDHNRIIEMLRSLTKDSTDDELLEFQQFLSKHRTYEEEIFYPKLDTELDEKQKKEIITKINTFK